jgi:hypothetical protein
MTTIEIRPFRNGWDVYEAAGVQPIPRLHMKRLVRRFFVLIQMNVSQRNVTPMRSGLIGIDYHRRDRCTQICQSSEK